MKTEGANFNQLHHGLLDRGVYIAPALYEAGFMSDEDIEVTIAGAQHVFKALRASWPFEISRHHLAQGGRRGLHSPAHARGRMFVARFRYGVNAVVGAQPLWQPRMEPAPASPTTHLGCHSLKPTRCGSALIEEADGKLTTLRCGE